MEVWSETVNHREFKGEMEEKISTREFFNWSWSTLEIRSMKCVPNAVSQTDQTRWRLNIHQCK